jgi:hypothetical protein
MGYLGKLGVPDWPSVRAGFDRLGCLAGVGSEKSGMKFKSVSATRRGGPEVLQVTGNLVLVAAELP